MTDNSRTRDNWVAWVRSWSRANELISPITYSLEIAEEVVATDKRIYEHPVLKFDRGRPLIINFNGKPVKAFENETVAAALYASGVIKFGYSAERHRPRGPFCMIGKCSQCLMRVDGYPHVRTCITPVEDGMIVEYEEGHDADLPLPTTEMRVKRDELEYDVAVIGAGPAGLSAALEASALGAKVLVMDQSPIPGGQLVKQTHKFFGTKESFAGMRGFEIAKMLTSELKDKENVDVMPSTQVLGYFKREGALAAFRSEGLGRYTLLKIRARSVIVATGAMEKSLVFPGNDLPGVMGAGAAQTLMNVFGIRPSDEPLIVGAGNVGVIVAYQALQAGIRVRAVIDIAKKSAAYLVHSSKIRRMGVPILMRHTIKEAYGRGRVEGATLYKVDDSFRPIRGSEVDVEADGIWLAVGLTPSIEVLELMEAGIKFVPELGGYVPLRHRNLETTIPGVFVAGDASCIEEASTAMMEGRVAGIAAAMRSGYRGDGSVKRMKEAIRWLDEFRSSPHYRRIREGLFKVTLDGGAS